MKKTTICLLAFLGMSKLVVAQSLTVSDIEALRGEKVTATLNISAPADTYTGIQLAFQFPSIGFSIEASGAIDKTLSSLQYGEMVEGKVKVAAANDDTFESATIDVEFTVDADLALGEYNVTISEILFEGPNNVETSISDVTFKVNVVSAHTIVLDETSTTPPSDATGVNVRVLRTIKANEWSTICLPFAMTEAQVKTAFGDDVKLGDFTGCVTTEDGDDVVGIKVNFGEATSIEANHPYIIKVSEAVSEFVVDNVNIAPSDNISVDMDELKQKIGTKWYYYYNSFIGTYEANTIIPELSLFLSDNKFWYSKGNTKMKAFRAYFNFYNVLTSVENAAARISMNFDEKETTGISVLKSNDNSKTFYDIQGRRVTNPTKGLYIQNGMKRVIK